MNILKMLNTGVKTAAAHPVKPKNANPLLFNVGQKTDVFSKAAKGPALGTTPESCNSH
jgi:hypothetical protein